MILKQEDWSIEKLRKDAAIKHGVRQETLHVARQLLRSVEFSDSPKMLIPFDRKAMDEFFTKLAKSLESGIFK